MEKISNTELDEYLQKRLQSLQQLKESGFISEEEYSSSRTKLLDVYLQSCAEFMKNVVSVQKNDHLKDPKQLFTEPVQSPHTGDIYLQQGEIISTDVAMRNEKENSAQNCTPPRIFPPPLLSPIGCSTPNIKVSG